MFLLGASGLLFWFPGAFGFAPALRFLTANALASELPETSLSPVDEPLQQRVDAGSAEPIVLQRDGVQWRLTPRADYKIAARVLHRKQYDDWQASLSPIDLALGWGMFSLPRIDDWIRWEQADRWYYYHYRRVFGVPFPRDYVREHSANVHIIPAGEKVETILRQLKGNEIVQLHGLLVDAETRSGAGSIAFRTSLSRKDEGDASCEIMYVQRAIVDGVEYR